MCACLCRKPRSPFWMAKFREADGRIVMRSTKCADQREALKVSLAWEDAAKLARKGELTQAASVKILRDLMQITGESLLTPSIQACLDGFLKSRETLGRSSSTAKRYQPIINGFISSLGAPRASASVASLSALEIERWRDSEVSAGKAPKTVNVGLGVLRACLNAAKRRGEILANPAEAVEPVAGRGDERSPFTDAEISALLAAAKGTDWETAVLVGAWTGLRLADVCGLTWGHLDLTKGILNIETEKTGKVLAIALAPEVRAHLTALRHQGVGKAALLPSLAGRKSGSNGALGGLSNEFKRLMVSAKITVALGRRKQGKGRQVSSKGFHSLRHTFVSRCAASGAGDAITKSMTGHTTDAAFRRYVHLGVDAQRKALSLLPKLGAAGGTS